MSDENEFEYSTGQPLMKSFVSYKSNTTVYCCKLLKNTKHYNKNQKVWVISFTGDSRIYVTGKRNGRFHYAKTWINKKDVTIKECVVTEDFTSRHNLKRVIS